MSKRIGVIIATLLTSGTVGLTGLASAASAPTRAITDVNCASACPDVFRPVTCDMSDGSVLTFSNSCFAGVYACQHGLKIISCREELDS